MDPPWPPQSPLRPGGKFGALPQPGGLYRDKIYRDLLKKSERYSDLLKEYGVKNNFSKIDRGVVWVLWESF